MPMVSGLLHVAWFAACASADGTLGKTALTKAQERGSLLFQRTHGCNVGNSTSAFMVALRAACLKELEAKRHAGSAKDVGGSPLKREAKKGSPDRGRVKTAPATPPLQPMAGRK